MVNGIKFGKISVARDLSVGSLTGRRDKIQGVKLPTNPAEAFEDFVEPVTIKPKQRKKGRGDPIKNLPSRPSQGIANVFGTDTFVKDSQAQSRRLSRGFR